MTKGLEFFKMNGAGNDFVVIDNRKGRVKKRSAVARHLCDRHRGIGADGLLLVERSAKAHYRMMYYNADGSFGGMCGNGGRCIAAFTVARKIAPRSHRFEALGHVYSVEVKSRDLVRLWMKTPTRLHIGHSLPYGEHILSVHTIDTGSPHAVVFIQKGRLKSLDVTGIGRWLRNHEAFQSDGVNVNFVEKIGLHTIKMRTYERGVEAETLACGTGSVACSILGSVLTGLKSPVSVITSSGDRLTVSFKRQGNEIGDVVLEGPAVISFRGNLNV